jgi:hypothetical protein
MDNIRHRNIGEEAKIMDDETRLNKIRGIIGNKPANNASENERIARKTP